MSHATDGWELDGTEATWVLLKAIFPTLKAQEFQATMLDGLFAVLHFPRFISVHSWHRNVILFWEPFLSKRGINDTQAAGLLYLDCVFVFLQEVCPSMRQGAL